jgi:hypothetical protein
MIAPPTEQPVWHPRFSGFGDYHLELHKVGVEFVFSLLENGEFGSSGDHWVCVAKGIVKDPNDILSISQLGSVSFNKGNHLSLGTSLQSVEGVCHTAGRSRDSNRITEELMSQLHDKFLAGVTVSIINGWI